MKDTWINFNEDKDSYMMARLNDDDTAVQVRLIAGRHGDLAGSVAIKDLTKEELIALAEYFTRMAKELYSED